MGNINQLFIVVIIDSVLLVVMFTNTCTMMYEFIHCNLVGESPLPQSSVMIFRPLGTMNNCYGLPLIHSVYDQIWKR